MGMVVWEKVERSSVGVVYEDGTLVLESHFEALSPAQADKFLSNGNLFRKTGHIPDLFSPFADLENHK
jgi:hypothetical protein